MNTRLSRMIQGGKIPNRGGVWIDAYNQSAGAEVAGTLTTRISSSNNYWITEMEEPKIPTPQERREPLPPEDSNALASAQNGSLLAEPKSCAIRGRGADNIPTLEIGTDVANCLTSVTKDSMVIGPAQGGVVWKGKAFKNGDGLYLGTSPGFFHGGISQVSRTLKAVKHDCGVVCDYRIRKLTPRECFRLMDVSDEDIDKIQSAGLSDSAQYELAGNSIVVSCLYLIFRNLFISEYMAPPAPRIMQPSLFDFSP